MNIFSGLGPLPAGSRRHGLRRKLRAFMWLATGLSLALFDPAARADPLEQGLFQAGGGLALGSSESKVTFLGRVMIGYVWHDNAVVAVDFMHSMAGQPVGRLSVNGQYYFGTDFLRVMLGAELGALNTHGATSFGIGIELGLPIFFTDRLALVPEVMIETGFFAPVNVVNAGVASVGVNLRYAF